MEEAGKSWRERHLRAPTYAEAVYRKVGLVPHGVRRAGGDRARRDLRGDRARRDGETVRPSRRSMCAARTSASAAIPKTGEEVPILPRRVMTFKASNVLKNRILRSHQTEVQVRQIAGRRDSG